MTGDGAEELRGRLRKVTDRIAVLRVFQENAEFSRIQQAFEDQVKNRRDLYELRDPAGMDTLVANEFLRGEISGFRTAIHLMTQEMETLKETADLLRASLRKIEETKENNDE